jgi:hypothetical protein
MLTMGKDRDNKLHPNWWHSRDGSSFRAKPPPVFETYEDFYEEEPFHAKKEEEEPKQREAKPFSSKFSYSGDETPPPTKEILYDLLRTLDIKDEEIKRLSFLLSDKERIISDLALAKDNLSEQVARMRDIVRSFSLNERVDPSIILEFKDEQEKESWKKTEKRYLDKIYRFQQQIEHLQERIREHTRRDLERNSSIRRADAGNIVSSLHISKDAPREVIEAVYKALTRLHHPDKGGSEEKMKEINAARDQLFKERGWTE